jgi:hypothetical protein
MLSMTRMRISLSSVAKARASTSRAQFQNRGFCVSNETPRYLGLEVDGFPSGTSTSFLKKVRMRSRWEAAMS